MNTIRAMSAPALVLLILMAGTAWAVPVTPDAWGDGPDPEATVVESGGASDPGEDHNYGLDGDPDDGFGARDNDSAITLDMVAASSWIDGLVELLLVVGGSMP